MLLSLLLTVLCFAAPAKEIWSLPYPGEKPLATFFDAASGALYVSVQDSNGRGRLDRVSLEGKLEKRGMATSSGEPGPIRAYDGKLYWVAGLKSVQIVDPLGARSSVQGVPELTKASDIAVDKDGAVYLIHEGKSLYRLADNKAVLQWGGKKINGLFLYLNRLFVLDDGRVLSLSVGKENGLVEREEERLCDCQGLERTSSGKWLTIGKSKVFVGNVSILTLKTEIGRPAYVFRMDPTEDFFVLPLPKEGMLRAYRMPGVEKAKKTEQ